MINPNTVARAYTELERPRGCDNRPGRGVFVAEPKDELTRDARWRRWWKFSTGSHGSGASGVLRGRSITARIDSIATVSMEPGRRQARNEQKCLDHASSSQSGSRSTTVRGAWSTAWNCASRRGLSMASSGGTGPANDDHQDAAGDGPAQLRLASSSWARTSPACRPRCWRVAYLAEGIRSTAG